MTCRPSWPLIPLVFNVYMLSVKNYSALEIALLTTVLFVVDMQFMPRFYHKICLILHILNDTAKLPAVV